MLRELSGAASSLFHVCGLRQCTRGIRQGSRQKGWRAVGPLSLLDTRPRLRLGTASGVLDCIFVNTLSYFYINGEVPIPVTSFTVLPKLVCYAAQAFD